MLLQYSQSPLGFLLAEDDMRATTTTIATLLLLLPTLDALAQRAPAQRVVPTAKVKPSATPTPCAATTAAAMVAQPKAAEVAHQALRDLVAWETTKAEKILQTHQKAFATTPDYQTAHGVLLAQQGEAAQGLDALVAATKDAPADPAPEYYRGEVLSWQGKNDAATTAWRAAADRAANQLDAHPKDARAAYYKGAALVGLKEPEKARQALEKAADEGFDPILTTYQTGLSYFVQGQWAKARDAFDAVLVLEPRFAYAYFYRGLAASKLGRKDQLNNDLHTFLNLAPDAPDAGNARALLAAFQH
jgi:tetratricopeptide (TPR) repeat protein